MKKSFTLIELLIVIGILAILVVTILITLNPSEAQKKARDVKRMKDLATLQAIILQYLNDGNPPICTYAPSADLRCQSNGAGHVQSQPCSNNWLNVNLCQYANSIPVDPLNGQSATVYSACTSPPTPRVDTMRYMLQVKGSDYEILMMQESKSDIGNLAAPGSTFDCSFVDVGSGGRIWGT